MTWWIYIWISFILPIFILFRTYLFWRSQSKFQTKCSQYAIATSLELWWPSPRTDSALYRHILIFLTKQINKTARLFWQNRLTQVMENKRHVIKSMSIAMETVIVWGPPSLFFCIFILFLHLFFIFCCFTSVVWYTNCALMLKYTIILWETFCWYCSLKHVKAF